MGLNEQREEVCQKYTSCILKSLRLERCACRDHFRTHDSVLKLLASSKLSDRLHPAIVQVMDELREDWQPEEVAKAFDALENFAVNMLEYPWKKEFHTILLYSGFYKARLEPNLQEPQLLLDIIGYKRVADNRLLLESGVPSRALLVDAAVDFFLAATECRVISSVVSRVEHATPVEVYWMRRANVGDEQACVDTLTLSRRPLSLDSDKSLTADCTNVDTQSTKFNTDVRERGDSPYDNVLPTTDDSKPLYGFLAQPLPVQSSNILPLRTDDLQAEDQLPIPLQPTFSAFRQQPNVMGQAVKSPLSNAGAVVQHRSPEAPPPVYSAAKDMPTAQLQNISYSQRDEVDALAAVLKNIDPHVMENATQRQQIISQLENYPSSSSGVGKADLQQKYASRQRYANLADTSCVDTGWQCQKCTFYNGSTMLVCEMCHSEKHE